MGFFDFLRRFKKRVIVTEPLISKNVIPVVAPPEPTEVKSICLNREDFKDDFWSLCREAIGITSTEEHRGSYFGGTPPKLEGFTWPTPHGYPLWFVGCIDCAELPRCEEPPPCETLDWLPKSGLILFFYDDFQGNRVTMRDGFETLYFPVVPPLHQRIVYRDAEVPADLIYAKSYKSFHAFLEWAPNSVVEASGIQLTEAQREAMDGWNEYSEKMGGFLSPIQNPLEEHCEGGAFYGLDCDDPIPENQAKAFQEGMSEWRLLLQVDEIPLYKNMKCGHDGILYYCIKPKDANKGDFSKTWMEMQCS